MEPSSPAYKIPESVLVVIHTAAFEVLLLDRADHPGYWQSVTGSKDTEDEPLTDTAVREVREETGIIVERRHPPVAAPAESVDVQALVDWHRSVRYEIYPQWRHRYPPGITRNMEHWFSLQVPRDIVVTLNPREHLHFEWLPFEEAAVRCFSPSNRDAILQLPLHTAR
jgi:dihydroneopterin triphosphate diphosphatase